MKNKKDTLWVFEEPAQNRRKAIEMAKRVQASLENKIKKEIVVDGITTIVYVKKDAIQ